jgi:acyl-CoA thioester hydrolase
MSDLLKDHPVVVEVPVAWGDMDAFAHVNNTRYFRWFEDARIAYFVAVGIHEIKDATGIGPILASTSCRFRIPLTFPDRLRIGARVSAFEPERFTMQYVVVSERHGKVAAEGEGLLVAFDYRAGRKAAYPEELAARIAKLQEGAVSSVTG